MERIYRPKKLVKKNIFLLNCNQSSKEKRIVISLILFRCAKRFILPQKTKTSENESEVFSVKIPQRKVTKCNTYNNSFFFIIVFLQFSGCLVLITTNKFNDLCWKEKEILLKIMRVNQRKILHKAVVGKYNFYTIE